jgi:hypothetical protein
MSLMRASRPWTSGRHALTLYVEQLPGDGGKDWGYTEKEAKAMELSKYWQRRFAADCRRVGTEARFYVRAGQVPA